jgi:hypothetical protein
MFANYGNIKQLWNEWNMNNSEIQKTRKNNFFKKAFVFLLFLKVIYKTYRFYIINIYTLTNDYENYQ